MSMVEYVRTMPRKTSQKSPKIEQPRRGLTAKELEAQVKRLADHEQRRAEEYQRYVESVRGLRPIERAEKFLQYITERLDYHGDVEALVYLRSRGHGIQPLIRELIDSWRAAANDAIQQYAPGPPPSRFWRAARGQEHHIDSAVLRAADWCEIGGFDDWWKRLARDFTEDVHFGGIEPTAASYDLASMARSGLALEMMLPALRFVLSAVRLPAHSGTDHPWQVYGFRAQGELVCHLGHAANLAFASVVIEGRLEGIGLEAISTLLSRQQDAGSWSRWVGRDKPSIETTAIAVHALSLSKARGWQHAVERAGDWLLTMQSDAGYWREPSAPDPVYLTVLVLDALALACGSRVTTLRSHNAKASDGDARDDNRSKRFRVALSFPGEGRALVGPVAQYLAERLGRSRVLYDRFHEAEFARPNLDIHLQRLYHDESELVVAFLGRDYERKEWCGLEWRAIRDLLKSRKGDIMLMRLDDGDVPGIYSVDGYIDVVGRSPEDLSELILARCGLGSAE